MAQHQQQSSQYSGQPSSTSLAATTTSTTSITSSSSSTSSSNHHHSQHHNSDVVPAGSQNGGHHQEKPQSLDSDSEDENMEICVVDEKPEVDEAATRLAMATATERAQVNQPAFPVAQPIRTGDDNHVTDGEERSQESGIHRNNESSDEIGKTYLIKKKK